MADIEIPISEEDLKKAMTGLVGDRKLAEKIFEEGQKMRKERLEKEKNDEIV